MLFVVVFVVCFVFCVFLCFKINAMSCCVLRICGFFVFWTFLVCCLSLVEWLSILIYRFWGFLMSGACSLIISYRWSSVIVLDMSCCCFVFVYVFVLLFLKSSHFWSMVDRSNIYIYIIYLPDASRLIFSGASTCRSCLCCIGVCWSGV